jgi:hypothetical protein
MLVTTRMEGPDVPYGDMHAAILLNCVGAAGSGPAVLMCKT